MTYLGLLGAYDFHDYGADFDFRTKGHIAAQERNAAQWAALAHGEGKPVFLSEFGTMAYGWVPDKPGPGSPPSVLAGSELVVRLANAGVDGFNRWSFLNRGDLDGQWQLVDTWDPQAKKLLAEFGPHPNSYFCLGLLSRFTAQHSAILGSRVEGGKLDDWQRVFCAAFRSPAGNLTLALVNDAPAEFQLKLSLQRMPKPASLHRYRYGEAQHDRADVKVNPQAKFSLTPEADELQDTLPANSLTIYSTYKLEHDSPGVIVESPQQAINYARPAEPAVKPALLPLPPGAVEPAGWLRDWAQAARDGITGHLDEWHPTFADGWKGVSDQGPRRQARRHRLAHRTVRVLAGWRASAGLCPARRGACQEDPRAARSRRGRREQGRFRHHVHLLEEGLQARGIRQLGPFADGPRAGGAVPRHRRPACPRRPGQGLCRLSGEHGLRSSSAT